MSHPDDRGDVPSADASVGCVDIDADGTILSVNDTFLRWTGYARAELSGRRLRDLFTRAGQVFHDTRIGPLLHLEGQVEEIALDVVCRTRDRLPVLLNIARCANRPEGPAGYRAVFFRARHRRRIERELIQARRKAEGEAEANAALMGQVSHDIRVSLNVILGATELLGGSDLSDDDQECLQILASSSEALMHLVGHYLQFSRLQRGGVRLASEPFDLRQLLADLTEQFGILARRKGLELRSDIDPTVPPVVVGDAIALRQVLSNLVGNAIKFTSRGVVEVRAHVVEQHDESVRIEFRISDAGPGMPDARQPAETGGLGLTIVRTLLDLHHANLEMTSRSGEGSTFSFAIPLGCGPAV